MARKHVRTSNAARPHVRTRHAARGTSHVALTLGLAAGLVVLVLAVYWPVGGYGFIDFDDPLYVSQNTVVLRGLTWMGAGWAFTATHAGNWHPVTWLSHMLDAQLHGAQPGGHHVTNLALHVANTLLLFAFLVRTTTSRWRSALVAALFGVHPLHVESVAWVAERKDVLSTLFLFLTLLAYSAYVRRPAWGGYASVCVLFGLGLMSKPMLVTLPVLLMLLDVWPLRRLESPSALGPRVVEKIPLFAMSIAVSVVTIVVQRQAGAVAPLESLPVSQRVVNAVVACGWYVAKTAWPSDLAAIYPYRSSLPWWEVVAAAAVIAGVTGAVIRLRTRRPYLLVGWLWFLVGLVPVIGLVQVGSQPQADRYTYVPAVGLFLMAAWGLADVSRRWPRLPIAVVAAAAVAAFAVAARIQIGYWSSSLALWSHAADVTSGNYRALANLGHALWENRRLDEAVDRYRAALEIKPDFAEAHNNLGLALSDRGDFTAATGEYRAAIAALPRFVEAHNNLGLALAAQHDVAGAVAAFSETVRLDPSNPAARTNLGIALAESRRFDRAIEAFAAALALQPDSAEARRNLVAAYREHAGVLTDAGRLTDAVAALRQAEAVSPDDPEIHYALGVTLARSGSEDAAARELQRTLELDAGHEAARAALKGLGRK